MAEHRCPVCGQHIQRDKSGWRIPRKGTKSEKIYEMMIAGKRLKEIHAEIGGPYRTIAVLAWKIRNPEAANLKNVS